MVLPDSYLDHDKPERMYAEAGLDAAGIVGQGVRGAGPGYRRPQGPGLSRTDPLYVPAVAQARHYFRTAHAILAPALPMGWVV